MIIDCKHILYHKLIFENSLNITELGKRVMTEKHPFSNPVIANTYFKLMTNMLVLENSQQLS